MTLPYGPPKSVSPLIRGLRWGLFIAGFFYARSKQRIYNSMEAKWRVEEEKRIQKRDKERAILKAKVAQEEKETMKLLESGKLFDPPAPVGDFDDGC